MQSMDLNGVEKLVEAPGLSVGFPFSSTTGTASTASVLIDLEPGGEVPTHVDSAEEILLVLEGEIEAFCGDESGRFGKDELAIVPAMVPHSLRNVGDGPARVFGFFSSSTVVSTFDDPLPNGERVNVIGQPTTLSV